MPGIQDRVAYYNRSHNASHDAGPSNGFVGRPPAASNLSGGGYYYSRDQQHPTSSTNVTGTHKVVPPRREEVKLSYENRHRQRSGGARMANGGEQSPSYWVEHLATFGVGRQYGLESPSDGIRKLKEMERNSAIWAQPMVLRLRPQTVVVEDENGEVVEQFPMELVKDPTAHLSSDPRDVYNNILLFVVEEDRRQRRGASATEMHIFQCNRVSANEVVNDFRQYLSGHFGRVRPGRRDTGFVPKPENVPGVDMPNGILPNSNQPVINSYTRTESREVRPAERERSSRQVTPPAPYTNGPSVAVIRDDVSASSDTSEYFERDVNTLNRCFDDIERFVARIQSAALAQREMELQRARRSRSRSRDQGILSLRAQLPDELEFVDVLQKFKLSFNLLAKLKNHIHEPNAPELLHFLFTPLAVILDACHWRFGRNIAPQVISPLVTREGRDLLRNCLTSKESDVWMALGDAWRIPPEDWPGALPPPYRPVFDGGFMPYGPPAVGIVESQAPGPFARNGASRRAQSVDNLGLDLDRISLEKDKLEFEKEKIVERERRIFEEEQKIQDERKRLAEEKRQFIEDQERRSVVSERPAPLSYYTQRERERESAQSSPAQIRFPSGGESPRQRAFLDELRARRAKIVQVTYDRVGQNPKELTVAKGEYLEVLNDLKKWWECRNIHNRIGYVPHTILVVLSEGSGGHRHGGSATVIQQPLFVQPGPSYSGPPSREERAGSSIGMGHSSNQSPTHRPAEFVDVQNVGVQASLTNGNYGYQQHSPYSQGGVSPRGAPAPPPPAPGPPPDLTPITTRPSFTRTKLYNQDEDQDSEIRAPRLEAFQRDKSEAELLREELQRTVGRGQGKADLLKKGKGGPSSDMVISESASEREVQLWLQSKGFSVRTLQVMEGQTGATVFALTKRQMQDFCGKDEGNRLYSQLLVQKNLTGYTTKSGAELKAILNMRKKKAEHATIKPGRAPPESPSQPPQPAPIPGNLDEIFHHQPPLVNGQSPTEKF